MFARTTPVTAMLIALLLTPACRPGEPAAPEAAPPAAAESATPPSVEAPVEQAAPAAEAAAEPAMPAEPGRTACGAISLVLPEGATVETTAPDENGFPGAAITLPDGTVMAVSIVGEAAIVTGAEPETGLREQVQRWLDELGPRMADEWTAEVLSVTDGDVLGAYAVAKSELSGQPGRAFAVNGFYIVGDYVAAIGLLHDDESGAAAERYLAIVRSAQWAGV